jgi:osmotically inducible lipoprotein OsmB
VSFLAFLMFLENAMKTNKLILVAFVLALSLLTACTNLSSRQKNAAAGAAVGGVAGAVLTGGSALGTVGGAAIGGVIGHGVDDLTGSSTKKK